MTTTYSEILRPAAAKALKPLAESVATLTRQLEHVRKRATVERGSVEGLGERLAALKNMAGEKLAGGQNAHASYLVALKRATANLAAAKEAVVLFETALIPASEAALAAAKKRLQEGFLAFVSASHPTCETRMAALIEQALAERDAYMSALCALAAETGGDFTGARKSWPEPIVIRPADSSQVGCVIAVGLDERLTDPESAARRRGDYLTTTPPAPEPSPAAPDGPQDAPDGRGPTDEAQESNPDARAPEVAVNAAPEQGDAGLTAETRTESKP